MFAQQIIEYLERIAADRLAASGDYEDATIDNDPVFATRQQADLAEKRTTPKRKKASRPPAPAHHDEPAPIAEAVEPPPSIVAPIVAAPGCFRSAKPNVVDMILPPLLARYRVTGWEIACMGHGGLLG